VSSKPLRPSTLHVHLFGSFHSHARLRSRLMPVPGTASTSTATTTTTAGYVRRGDQFVGLEQACRRLILVSWFNSVVLPTTSRHSPTCMDCDALRTATFPGRAATPRYCLILRHFSFWHTFLPDLSATTLRLPPTFAPLTLALLLFLHCFIPQVTARRQDKQQWFAGLPPLCPCFRRVCLPYTATTPLAIP